MRKVPILAAMAAMMLVVACAPQRSTQLPPRTQTKIAGTGVAAIDQRTKIGLLVPLSGENEAVGQHLFQAAQLALTDTKDDRLVLLPRDTGTSAGAAADTGRAALAEGARAFLGPLFGSATRGLAPSATAAGVPVLSFSNDISVAAPGIVTLGFGPEQQVERIVAYAAGRGLKRLAILAPSDAFGERFVAAARRAVGANPSLQIVGTGRYAADKAAPSDTVKRLVYPNGEPTDEAAPPPDPFDAVLIGDTGRRLRTVVSLINYFDVDLGRVKILGTQRWQDDPAGLADPLLEGAWIAAPDPAGIRAFERRYADVFGDTPPRVAVLAYDATALLARLAAEPGGITTARLTDPEGFAGRGGVFRIRPDGRVERGQAVLEVLAGGALRVLEPAPSALTSSLPTN